MTCYDSCPPCPGCETLRARVAELERQRGPGRSTHEAPLPGAVQGSEDLEPMTDEQLDELAELLLPGRSALWQKIQGVQSALKAPTVAAFQRFGAMPLALNMLATISALCRESLTPAEKQLLLASMARTVRKLSRD